MRIRSKQNCPFVPTDGACTYTNSIGTNCAAAGYGPGQAGSYTFADEIEDYSVKIGGGTVGTNNGNNTYLWTPATGLNATNIANPTASPTQTTTYTLTVTDTVNDCSSNQQVTVTVAGTVDVVYTVGSCSNDLYNITGTITTGVAPTTGNLIVEDCNDVQTIVASAPFTGTSFPFTLNGQTADGNNCALNVYFSAANCPETVNFTAPVPCSGCITPFVHASTFTNENCNNGDGQITLNINSGGVAPFTYSVDNGTTTQTTGTFNNLAAGVYNVVITDDQGCMELEQITLTNSSTSNSAFNFDDFCQGAINGPSNIATPGGAFAFVPAVTGGATINGETGVISNGVGGSTYSVQYTLNGACPSSSNQQVTVGSIPAPLFDGSNLSSCEPINLNFSSDLNFPEGTCLWTFGDGTTSSNCSANHTFSASGSYDVTLTVTSQLGCSGSHTGNVTITINPFPTANFTANPLNPTIINPNVNFINQSTNSTSYEWTFGDNSAPSSLVNPSHTYPNNEAGNYLVTLVAFNGTCTDTATTIIPIEEELVFYVPNAFTPDGDEHNPVFKPVFSSGYDPQDYQLLIFDRWGELIFESHDTKFGWDGTYLGVAVHDNTFIWKITIKETMSDKKYNFDVHVTIVR